MNPTLAPDSGNAANFDLNDGYKTVITIARITSSMSMFGSIYIVQDVLRNPRKRSESIYHRLMLGLSIMDILSSFVSYFLYTWPLPRGYIPEAVGTVVTCDLTAFFFTIGLFAAPLYNSSLATYYLLLLKYNWTKSRIKDAEKWLHLFPITVALITAIVGLATKAYGPYGKACWITSGYPASCEKPDSSEECIRGGKGQAKIFVPFIYLCCISSFIFVSTTMFIIYKHILKIEKQAYRFSFAMRRSERNNRKRSHRVMIQGTMYGTAMFLIYISPILHEIALVVTSKVPYYIRILWNVLSPLQGFFNFLIYLMPVYVKIHKKQLEKKRAQMKKEGENKKYLIKPADQIIKDKPHPSQPKVWRHTNIEGKRETNDMVQNNNHSTKSFVELQQSAFDDQQDKESNCDANISEQLYSFYSTNEFGDAPKEEMKADEDTYITPNVPDNEEEDSDKKINFLSILSAAMQDESDSDCDNQNDSDVYYW